MADLLNEAIMDEAKEKAAAAALPEDIIDDFEPAARIAMPDLSFLAAPTGPGSVEEYIAHPLNFDGKKSTARILRGLTGLCGELNYALVDIGLGTIEKMKERGSNEPNNSR